MESSGEMICQTCGSTGFSNAIVKCAICKTSVEHQYCLEKRPTVNEVMHWLCRKCKPKPLKTEALAKVGLTLESFGFIRTQSHYLGSNHSCHFVNGYDELSGFSPVRIGNYLHSPGKQFESMLEARKSSYVSPLMKEAFTTSMSSYSTPSEGMSTLQSESNVEITSLVENGRTSAGSCGKPSDHGRFVRPRRRMLLPEEEQLDQVHGINIIGDKSRRKSSNSTFLYQSTDSTSTAEKDKQVYIENKRKFAWSDEESVPIITDQNSQKGTLNRNGDFLLQVVNHASTIGENDPSEVPDGLQAASVRYRAEKVSLRQKRKLTQSYKGQSVEVHDNIIAQDASTESFLADKGITMVIHHASMVQINSPDVAGNRFQSGTQAQPIMHQIWRGCFVVCDREYGPLVAHLSSKACKRVQNATRILPHVMQMEKLSRCEAWPKCFKTSPPSDENIALYFFAQHDRIEIVNELLDDVIKNDLMLKIVLDEAELLVFSSIILPENSQIFQGRYYLWGAFKRRKTGTNSGLRTLEVPERQQIKKIPIMPSQSVSFEPQCRCPFPKPFKKVIGQEVHAPSIAATSSSGKPLALCQGTTLPEQIGVITAACNETKRREMWANAKKRIEYEAGDLVLVRLPLQQDKHDILHEQQDHYYEGPFQVLKKVGKAMYKLKISHTIHRHSIFNASLLKLHRRKEDKTSQSFRIKPSVADIMEPES